MADTINVRVVLSFSTHHEQRNLVVLRGTSARAAVHLAVEAGLPLHDTKLDPIDVPIGVFGEQVADDYQLADGDRVEIYRPLQQDPKELRRLRAKQDTDAKRNN